MLLIIRAVPISTLPLPSVAPIQQDDRLVRQVMPPPSRSWRRFHSVVRWFPFAFILGILTFAWGVLLQLHISYTIAVRREYVGSTINIVMSCVLAGMAIWSFLVAVFKSPGHPDGTRSTDSADGQWDQRPSRGGAKRRSVREEQVGLTDDVDDSDVGSDDERSRDPRDRTNDYNADVFTDNAATALLPGQPQAPARTGRSQLDDLLSVVERAKQESADGRLYLSGLQVKNTGVRRWCKQCHSYKPDRAHHCSTCGVCVLRMDHHCPWLASKCIGLRNHKAFFLFLAYTSLLCCFAAQDTGRALLGYVEDVPNGYETAPITWAIILFLGGIFGLALVPFSAYHAYLICRNRTTLESMEGAGRVRISVQRPSNLPPREDVSDRLRKLAGRTSADATRSPKTSMEANRDDDTWRRDEQLTREERRTLRRANKLNIYNVGVRRNWQFIMGSYWPVWLVPLGDPISDGQSYEVNEATLKELEQTTAQIRNDQAGRVQRLQIERSQLAAEAGQPQRFAAALQSSTPSPTISSVRGQTRPAMQNRSSSGGGSAAGQDVNRERHQSAHGVAQWGARPKKDFVLFGLGDDDEDSGGVLGRTSSSSSSSQDPRPAQAGSTQMDADVWSS